MLYLPTGRPAGLAHTHLYRCPALVLHKSSCCG